MKQNNKVAVPLLIWRKMKNNYDVVVVGAGPAGIMACYELYLKQPELNVLLIDKGQDVMKRHCPIKEKERSSLSIIRNNEPGCLPACSITAGFGGAGAYSDGKFNITSEFGGWLTLTIFQPMRLKM